MTTVIEMLLHLKKEKLTILHVQSRNDRADFGGDNVGECAGQREQ